MTHYKAAENIVKEGTLGIIFVLRHHLKGADPAKESSVPGGQVKMRFTFSSWLKKTDSEGSYLRHIVCHYLLFFNMPY